MTKFRLIGVAAVLFSVLAGPTMARHVISRPVYPAQSIFCATREAGNPHSKYCDYIEWSKWRQRGGWDSSLDNACWHNLALYRENAVLMHRAKYSLGHTHEVIIPPLPK
jgi:hypothetical protein